MHAADSHAGGVCDLDSVIATHELSARGSRRPDTARETEVLVRLHRELAVAPATFFQRLVEAALELSHGDSAGISLLNEDTKRFIWPAVAGPFYAYLWEGTPSDFGPCGTVLRRNATQLMRNPERHFTYLTPIKPGLAEVLLVPFYVDEKAVGTIWAVIHEKGRQFDAEDGRLLESLSGFAASAYRTLSDAGLLAAMLVKSPAGMDASGCVVAPHPKTPALAEPPRHQCMVYQGAPSAHLGGVAHALLQRLKSNYRCLYLNSPPMVAGMRWHLTAAGIDLAAEKARGSLILSSDQSHLLNGQFDSERMLATLRDALHDALAAGFAGLWASGDMTWEFGSERNLDKLLDYERGLDAFLKVNPKLCGICLYHRDTLPAHAIATAQKMHPATFVSATLSQLNPLYL